MRHTTTNQRGLTVVNGIAYLGNQFMGASASVPIADVFAASLASGAQFGGKLAGSQAATWPPVQPGVGK